MALVISEPKTIPLSENSRLVFDFDGSEYRMAYYHPVRNRRGQYSIARDTAKAPKLIDALCSACNVDAPNNTVRGIEGYIRATEWGKDLP